MRDLGRVELRRGFSLIEVLISFAIMMILGGTLLAIFAGQMQLTATHNRNIINQEDIRDVLVFMGDELSLTGTAAQEPFLSAADPDNLCFIADLDGNDVPDQVRYQLVGSDLTRTLYATEDGGVSYTQVATDIILPNVSSLAFTYFGPGNAVSPAIDSVTSIEIKLTVNVDATSTGLTHGKLAPQDMVSRVTLRNRLL